MSDKNFLETLQERGWTVDIEKATCPSGDHLWIPPAVGHPAAYQNLGTTRDELFEELCEFDDQNCYPDDCDQTIRDRRLP